MQRAQARADFGGKAPHPRLSGVRAFSSERSESRSARAHVFAKRKWGSGTGKGPYPGGEEPALAGGGGELNKQQDIRPGWLEATSALAAREARGDSVLYSGGDQRIH